MQRGEFEKWLNENLGEYSSHLTKIDYLKGSISYSKPLFINETIWMVIYTPYVLNYMTNSCKINEENLLKFFLYDTQTDLVFGNITEIEFDEPDWSEILLDNMYLVEERLEKSFCPKCDFWLVERINQHGHKFMGCSGFPDCRYSSEIDKIYE